MSVIRRFPQTFDSIMPSVRKQLITPINSFLVGLFILVLVFLLGCSTGHYSMIDTAQEFFADSYLRVRLLVPGAAYVLFLGVSILLRSKSHSRSREIGFIASLMLTVLALAYLYLFTHSWNSIKLSV